MIRTPYLLFLGDAPDQLAAKVAQGIQDWRPDNVVGQFRVDGCNADVGAQDMTLSEAYEKGARTLDASSELNTRSRSSLPKKPSASAEERKSGRYSASAPL